MSNKSFPLGKLINRLYASLDRLLYGFSTYALAILVGLVSLIALLAWDTSYPSKDTVQLTLRGIGEKSQTFTPAQALAELKNQPELTYLDTRRAEEAFWVTFALQRASSAEGVMVDFPSRHAVDTSCWDATTRQVLGRGDRQQASGNMTATKAGFSLSLGQHPLSTEVLCRIKSVGPARISLTQMTASDLKFASLEFQRNSGLLDGGLIILSLFVLVTAVINRESTYVLFSVWLIFNLRMGALSAGWDTQWLGQKVPQELVLLGRSITLAFYYTLTIVLFKALFRDQLPKVGFALLLRISVWSCLPLLVMSLSLPYKNLLPLIWTASAYSIATMIFLLLRILLLTRSPVAIWYNASNGITLSASFYEVISAALGFKGLIGSVNSVTAALASSLMASLAIAAQMREEHNQRLEAQAELQHTFEAMPIGMFTLNFQGQFTSANPALLDMLGHNVLNAGHNGWQQHFNHGSWAKLYEQLQNRQDAEIEIEGTRAGTDGEATPRRYLVKAVMARDKVEGSLQDVTEKAKATQALGFLAHHDSLTKVLNRRGIELEFEKARVMLEAGQPMAMAYLDLDRFKLINDLFGHPAGDVVLQQVCERVSHLLSAGIQIGRVGGDEFVVVFPNTNLPLAAVICRGIVDSIGGAPYRVGEKAFHVRGSIGLIEIRTGTGLKDALSTADRACSKAKVGQNKGLVVYEQNAPAFLEHEAEIRLVEQLSAGDDIEGLFLEMQPIMSLSRPHESLNFEVLLRMRGKDGKLVPVNRLIAAGEHSGRMSVIDRWVLTTTLAWLNRHHAQLKNMKFVCMNLSGASLNDEEFILEIFRLLEENNEVVRYLSLEVTESVALHDLKNTRRFIDKVRGYGAKVALDDFGAGYTSFSYLKELPADLLKIDGSFIVDMNQHPANIAIVEAIVNLARNLGMKTIAEWAEDNATVQTLAEIGVDYVQGYAVARPQPCDNMLTAESSASFITDEALIQICRLMGTTKAPQAKNDPALQDDLANFH